MTVLQTREQGTGAACTSIQIHDTTIIEAVISAICLRLPAKASPRQTVSFLPGRTQQYELYVTGSRTRIWTLLPTLRVLIATVGRKSASPHSVWRLADA